MKAAASGRPIEPIQTSVGKPRKPKLKASGLYELMRSDILHCRLKPGARLMFKELAERYGSGISQLRETLMRLVADGLVELESHKGFRIAQVSQDELLDIVRTRSSLEELAIRDAIGHGDLRWEANIMARYHEVSNLPVFDADGLLSEEWDQTNTAFHEALFAACTSRILVKLCHELREQYGRYRRVWVKYGNAPAETMTDHELLMRAVIRRDADTAASLIRRHFDRTAKSILDNWSAVPTVEPPVPNVVAPRLSKPRR